MIPCDDISTAQVERDKVPTSVLPPELELEIFTIAVQSHTTLKPVVDLMLVAKRFRIW